MSKLLLEDTSLSFQTERILRGFLNLMVFDEQKNEFDAKKPIYLNSHLANFYASHSEIRPEEDQSEFQEALKQCYDEMLIKMRNGIMDHVDNSLRTLKMFEYQFELHNKQLQCSFFNLILFINYILIDNIFDSQMCKKLYEIIKSLPVILHSHDYLNPALAEIFDA